MVFFGQRESSPSGDSSGSDSDSEEKRFYAKVNNSQRQQSSSTAGSSSDSEPEHVSTRPATEKPVALPSPKKKPDASDRSTVRNQGIPSEPDPNPTSVDRSAVRNQSTTSEPNPNPPSVDRSAVRNQSTPSEPNPNTPSVPKPKRAAAAKRSKDDDFAEGQPEPKKKSVSKGKKAAEEEAAKDDDASEEQTELKKKSVAKGKKPAEEEVPASDPTKKKPRKQSQESAAAVPVATPSAKDSPQKSSKKIPHVWTDNDENVIMHGYLVSVKEGLEFPKNMLQLLEKINDLLSHEANKTQLYEKLRRMKGRYVSIQNKIAQGNIKEDVFAFKNPHEKKMYKLWKKAWGEPPEEDEVEVGVEVEVEPAGDAMELDLTEAVGDDTHRTREEQITAGGLRDDTHRTREEHITAGDRGEEDEEEDEEEVESDADTDTAKEPKTPSTEKALVSNHIPAKAPVSNHITAQSPDSSLPMPNGKPENRLDYDTIMKETRDMMAEVVRDVKKMAEASEAELKALLDSHTSSANGTRGTGGGSVRRINSAVWIRNREPGLDGIYSLRELPPLDEARVQMLEGKWREVHALEMQTSLRRYATLQEECSAHLESLKTSKGNARS